MSVIYPVMREFFQQPDPFNMIPGSGRIAIGAPHNGTRPNVNADLGSGQIASALAARLGGRAVIVSNLRRMVDVNKNPLRYRQSLRVHAVRYQDELFSELPALLVEIHGHISGMYAVEISCGFELDPAAPGDALFLERLRTIKQALSENLENFIGQKSSVGVYPLDRNVKNTATDTFTFQKIRRARNLVGLEWYGLHIEINAELRTTQQARTESYQQALADVLAMAINAAFLPLPQHGTIIPIRGYSVEGYNPTQGSDRISADSVFKVELASEQLLSNMHKDSIQVLVHPTDMELLGALEGDTVSLCNGNEEFRANIQASQLVPRRRAVLPARLRNQIGLSKNDHVLIQGITTASFPQVYMQPRSSQNGWGVVNGAARPERALMAWLSPDEIMYRGLTVGKSIQVQGQPVISPVSTVTLQADSSVPCRVVELSRALKERISITIGEVVSIKKL
jgi:hypothetical protein